MSEELIQSDLIDNPPKFGNWKYYDIGSTTVSQLKKAHIIRDIDYGEFEKNKPDMLIIDHQRVLVVLESKTPKEFKTEKQQKKAIEQEIETASALGSKIFIAQGGTKTIWLNALTKKEICYSNGIKVTETFTMKNKSLIELIEKISNSINSENNNIKPDTIVDPTHLARQIWQDIWLVSGATPENCLYTFVELFIFKYLSDLEILETQYNFYEVMRKYTNESDDSVLEYYATTIRPQIKKLFPQNEVDRTTIINGTIFVSKDQKAVSGYSGTFKKVLKKFKSEEKLEHIDHEFKSRLFESFLKESISKKNWGQFFTPLKVVQSIAKMATNEIKQGIKICDPACGVGKFLLEPLADKLDQFYEIVDNKLVSKITICGFDKGFDKDEQKTIILAKANMLIYFSDIIKKNKSMTKKFANLFNDTFTLKTNSILGTLSEPIINEYDLILTNPPYVMSGSSNLKEEIGKDARLEAHYEISGMGVEGLFMEWIVRALKPKGKAFIVVPNGLITRGNDVKLRQFILDNCFIDALISLPHKTFFSTTQKTYIMVLTKKHDLNERQEHPVFTYLVSEIGETLDTNRFDIEQNDLLVGANLFLSFNGNKDDFEKLNVDKRCKIFPITKFNAEDNWLVDRWWSEKEKIDLGIIMEPQSMDIIQFSEFVSDVANQLSSYSNELKSMVTPKESELSIEIQLSDKKYFDLTTGKRVVRENIVRIKDGTIPIYSANVFKPIGKHKEDILINFENDFVIWGIDGNFKFNFIKKNTPFYPTDHCGVIRIYDENILPEYVMLELEKHKNSNSFDRSLRATPQRMGSLVIKVPVDETGNISYEKQLEKIKKWKTIFELNEQIKQHSQIITDMQISKNNNEQKYVYVPFKDVFKIISGNDKLTKKYVEDNKGTFVVYSSNTKNNGVFGYIDTHDHDFECIQITTNGVYAGTVFYRHKHEFSINNDAKILLKKSELLDYKYLTNELRRELKKHGFNWTDKPSKSKLKKLFLRIPSNGKTWDLKVQKEMAELDNKIDDINQNMLINLDDLKKMKVNL